ncbi:MAG: tetratricopeptide repeat protein [bacterium]
MSKPIFITLLILTMLMPLFFLPFNTDPINFPKSVLFIGLVLLALLFWLIKILKEKKIKIKRTILDYPIIALVVIYFCSALLSVDKYVSFSKFVVILFMGIFYFLAVQIINKKRRIMLLCALVYSSLIAGMVLLISNLQFGILNFKLNLLGTQSALVALLAILAVIVYKWRWLMILPITIILAILLLINFKIGWYVLGAGTLVYLVFGIANTKYKIQNTKYQIIPMIVLAISILMIVLNINIAKYFVGNGLKPFLTLPAEVGLSKQLSWDIAFKNSTENIKQGLLGSGPDTFWYAFSKYRPERFNQNALWQIRFQRANNFWLENLATIGWLGALAWLLIFGLGIWKNPKYIAPIFIVGIFTNFNVVLLFILFLFLGIVRNGLKPFPTTTWQLPGSSMGLGFVLILAGIIIFGVFIGRIYAADYYFMKNNISQSIKLNQYNPQYHLALSQTALADLQGMRDKEKAEILLARAVNSSKKAIDMSPYNAAFYQVRAQIFTALQQKDWAIKSYEKAIELEPTNPVLYQELGKIKEDIGILEKAVALKSDLAVAQYELGRIYYNQSEINKAEACFIKAIAISPNYSNALYSLALVYQKQGKKEEALKLFEKVLELNPDNEEVKNKINQFGG